MLEWVKYFVEVSEKQDSPGLQMLSKVCHKFLKQKGITYPAVEREVLPSSLSSGSCDEIVDC